VEAVEATGAALLFEGEMRTVGDVPSTTLALREIGRWLDAQPQGGVIATASLGRDAPQFELLTAIASGLLATPVATSSGNI
jgi:chemotaxis family two-component system sensor kinase Cph1